MLQAQASSVVTTAKDRVVEKLPIGHSSTGSDPYGPGPVPTTHGTGSATTP
jgi:hypothetical protein